MSRGSEKKKKRVPGSGEERERRRTSENTSGCRGGSKHCYEDTLSVADCDGDVHKTSEGRLATRALKLEEGF